MTAAQRIAIIIDDEPANRDFLVRLIQQAGIETKGAGSGEEAKKIISALQHPPNVIIIDSQLPDIQGTELIKHFRAASDQTTLIMATMLDDRPLIDQAFQNGCDAFLVKPHGFMELFKRLQTAPDDIKNLIIDQHGTRTYRGA